MAKLVKKSVLPLYTVAALWVVYALFGKLYTIAHFVIMAIATVAVYLVMRKLCPHRVILVPDPVPAPEPAPAAEPGVAALMAERDRALSEMRRLNDSIEDEKISAQIDHMERMTDKIMNHVAQQPQKLSQIRRFLDYYLPTTLKLLNAYDRMDSAGVAGANIDGTMGKIDAMLDRITTAFDRQLDALFADEALDIDTDITVMEQMLSREGIGGTQMPGM